MYGVSSVQWKINFCTISDCKKLLTKYNMYVSFRFDYYFRQYHQLVLISSAHEDT